MSDANIVYVGSKPVMNYVIAVLANLNQDRLKDVVLRARGRAISTAVDTAEVTRNRFLSDLTYNVSIGTEAMPREEGGTRNVSTIDIILRRDVLGESTPSAEDKSVAEKAQNLDDSEDESSGEKETGETEG